MTKYEAQQAWKIAEDENIALDNEDLSPLFGYGKKTFQPVYVTLRQVAAVMRWQGLQMNGLWDMREVSDLITLGRRNFIILN